MDPQTALTELLEAFELQDRDTAIDRLEALTIWVKRGGFLPNVQYDPDTKWRIPERLSCLRDGSTEPVL